MGITTTILQDDPTKTIFRDFDDVAVTTTTRTVWKSGTPQDNAAQLQQRALAALTANNTFLALAAPTNAQTLAQVQRLTRQMDALLRLLVTADTSDISDA